MLFTCKRGKKLLLLEAVGGGGREAGALCPSPPLFYGSEIKNSFLQELETLKRKFKIPNTGMGMHGKIKFKSDSLPPKDFFYLHQ